MMVNPGGEPFPYDPTLTPYADGINDACDHIDVRVIAVKGNTRSAKALALDTPLPTPTGWTTMGEIEEGDWLLGRDGKPCLVTLTTPVMQGKRCYRVGFSDGSTIVADADHLWEVEKHVMRRAGTNGPRSHDWETVVLSTEQMVGKVFLAGRRARYRIRNCIALDLPRLPLLIPPYVLGAWLGDGTSRGAGLTFHRDDAEIVKHIEREGFGVDEMSETATGVVSAVIRSPGTGTGICPRGHNRAETGQYRGGECIECVRLRYRQDLPPRITTMVEMLDAYALRQNKHIPPAYLRSCMFDRLALLQGLMDTDGTIAPGGSAVFTSTSRCLADGVFELAASLGLKPTIREREASCIYKGERKSSVAWSVGFKAYRSTPVFRMARKLANQPSREAGRPTDAETRRIQSIEPVESVPVRCIQVDNADHLFLAGRAMIPTHNTVSAENMVLRNWTYGPLKNVLWFMQDQDSLNDYIDERGEEMLDIHPEVFERIDWTDSRNNSRTRKRIGRSLTLWRPATRRALRAKAAPTIVADEIDAYAKNVRDAIMTLVTSRQEEFGTSAKAYLCSHPDAGPDGGIDLVLKDSLLHLWFARCPECGHAASPAVEAEDQDKPRWKWNVPDMMGLADEMDRVAFLDHVAKSARLVCPNDQCRKEFTEDRRLEIMNAGRWLQPHQEWHPNGRVTGDARVASTMGFVIHAFMAPFVKFNETARDYAAAMLTFKTTGQEVHLREVIVKKLGETPRSTKAEEQVDAPKIVSARLASAFPLKSVPAGVMFLTAFVDVQVDRFEVVVIGWNLQRESWLVDRYSIKQWPAFGDHGAFDNIDPANRLGDWDVIEEAVVAASYPLQANPQRLEAGMEELFLPIGKVVVNNAGLPGVTNNGRKWLSKMLTPRPGRRLVQTYQVMLMQGSASKTGEPYGGRSKPVEFDDLGQKLITPVFERYPNVHDIKKIIASRMKIDMPGPGRMHIPSIPPLGSGMSHAEYQKFINLIVFELTAERFTNDEWTPIRMRNETWDGWVACEVGRESLKPDRAELWAGELPEWVCPKPRGQGLGSVVTAPEDVFDRLAKLNSEE